MASLLVDISIDSSFIEDENHWLKGLICLSNLVCGEIKISKAEETFPTTAIQSSKRTAMPLANFNAKKKAVPPKGTKESPKQTAKSEPNPQLLKPNLENGPKLNASDMIKIMQDFETKKKTYCCVVCKYETVHNTTIKRHVETKHMPQTVSLNCLQLVDQAAKAMLP